MEVQAHQPSNAHFLNRDLEEEKNPIGGDYRYQPQSRGGERLIYQPQMLFSNGVSANPSKRFREITANSSSSINPFSLQPQPSQVSDFRLACGDRRQQQSLFSHSSALCSHISDDLAAQIGYQRDEIEQSIQTQAEQLRSTLAQKRQSHYRALLVAAEESVRRRLKQKEAEAAKASQRIAELEARAAELRAEALAWQARARAGESAAASLQAELQQAIGSTCAPAAEEMTASGRDGGAEDAESAYVDPDRVVAVATGGGPMCRACRRRAASVVLIPCRHLSMCTECNRSISSRACPVCFTLKEFSAEVYFS